VGASLAIDFLQLPSGDDLCRLTPAAQPANPANYYCTLPDGSDFPARNAAGGMENGSLVPGQAGHVDGGIGSGNVRAILSIEYAPLPNLLVGGRVGYVFNTYTGTSARTDGRASGPLHLEIRGTYLFGRIPLRQTGFAPMAFAGGGFSEFDRHTTASVSLRNLAGQQPVNVWLTDGPFFAVLGGGVRYSFSPRAAFTGALRLNGAFGSNGLLFTYGPEIGMAYGF
jgi:hypothetical protein